MKMDFDCASVKNIVAQLLATYFIFIHLKNNAEKSSLIFCVDVFLPRG